MRDEDGEEGGTDRKERKENYVRNHPPLGKERKRTHRVSDWSAKKEGSVE